MHVHEVVDAGDLAAERSAAGSGFRSQGAAASETGGGRERGGATAGARQCRASAAAAPRPRTTCVLYEYGVTSPGPAAFLMASATAAWLSTAATSSSAGFAAPNPPTMGIVGTASVALRAEF